MLFKSQFTALHALLPSITAYLANYLALILCLTGFKSPSAALHYEVSHTPSEWQDEALRDVHTFLCTTHHPSPAPFTLKPHRMICGVFMTDLGWLLRVTFSAALASPAADGTACFGLYHGKVNIHIDIYRDVKKENEQTCKCRVQTCYFHCFEGFPTSYHKDNHCSCSSPSIYIIYITL